ncbi:alpha/beta fold hydrolase [Nocardia sp. NPDC049526]|uniref:alpha/beta fold hydrolase n=1 Tax=Nocardia sp. NPDC049526 TaxID=3364316 RepID=UPI0037AED2B3
MRSETLEVPGATLYFEVRGNGPVLLLLPGSGGDAGIFDPIADALAAQFTVVAADPRGYSRSVLDAPEPVDQRMDVLSDDAYRLLEHLTPAGQFAYVAGVSGGAVVALDLLARHPERLRLVVAHEPPCFAVLPDADAHRAMVEEVVELARDQGPAVAGGRFMQAVGVTSKPLPNVAEVPARTAEMLGRLMGNAPLMFAHELRAVTDYRPDTAALAAVVDRLVLAAGRETRGQLPYRTAETLATELDRPLVEFPGGHSGVRETPAEFARALLEALTVTADR